LALHCGQNTSFSGFIEAQINEGRSKGVSDGVRAGLRLLEEQEARHVALRAALAEGEESGMSNRSVQDIPPSAAHSNRNAPAPHRL
jgi:antitoxin ParD1/3/4